MRELTYTIAPEQDGISVKTFLRRAQGMSSRVLIRLKKMPGGITVNGAPVHVPHILHTGDRLVLRLADEQPETIPAELPLQIAYEDDDLLIADKPPGMPTHPHGVHRTDTLANAVAAHYKRNGLHARVRPLYRLDADTSGLVVFAKHAAAAQTQIDKRYYAIVSCAPGALAQQGTVDLPLGRPDPGSIRRAVLPDGQHAITHYRVLAQEDGYAHLALQLQTGRTHQIRAHFAHIGCPLLGDRLYGGATELIARQALHCGALTLIHPVTGKRLAFYCPFPEDYKTCLRTVRLPVVAPSHNEFS